MNKIIFATSNKRKIAEATTTFAKYGIEFETREVDIDEIQHHDPAEITKAKARAAYEVIHQPAMVQDTSWNIPALGGFPGGYMKDTANWWHANDWMNIMKGYDDKRIICLEHVAYFDGETMHHFEAGYEGRFVDTPRGGSNGHSNSIEKSISLDGIHTFAELHDMNNQASASDTHEHWEVFAKWYRSIF